MQMHKCSFFCFFAEGGKQQTLEAKRGGSAVVVLIPFFSPKIIVSYLSET